METTTLNHFQIRSTILMLVCLISFSMLACSSDDETESTEINSTEDSITAGMTAGTVMAGTTAGTVMAGTTAGTVMAGTTAGTVMAGTTAGTVMAGTTAGTAMAGMTAGTAMAGMTAGTAVMSSDCDAYCTYLENCNSCLNDANGDCLPQDECVTLCDAEVPAVVAACVAPIETCDEALFLACYDDNIGDDDCAKTCRLLEECDECFVDENNECLSLAGCALICREQTPAEIATCIASQSTCDGIDLCYE